jgi:predicted Zn-dependent protease
MRDNARATAPSIGQCREIFERVQRAAKSMGVPDVEMLMGARTEALTRFANNAIHQNVAETSKVLSVRALIGNTTARATTNRMDPDAIHEVVEQAITLTKAAAPNDDVLPLAAPLPVSEVPRFDSATANSSPEDRARSVAEAIRLVEAASQTAAGIYSTEHEGEAIFNSAGLAAWHSETMARFSITAIAEDSSGWAKASATTLGALHPLDLAHRACEKAKLSRRPREVPPGEYVVILEPAATLDLVGQVFGDFSATALEDQHSFLTERLGTKLFGENIHIVDDCRHPLQSGAPFDGEGVLRRKLALVEHGVPREIAYSRAAARRAGVEPTGHGFPLPNDVGEAPMNIVVEGGSSSLDEMIACTERGILVTRFWYIREVDPYEKIMTGMTRDGTFLIEGGRLVCGLKNFRFNQSLIELLNSVEAMSPSVRASGEEAMDMVVPAMKVRNFHFSELTKF